MNFSLHCAGGRFNDIQRKYKSERKRTASIEAAVSHGYLAAFTSRLYSFALRSKLIIAQSNSMMLQTPLTENRQIGIVSLSLCMFEVVG